MIRGIPLPTGISRSSLLLDSNLLLLLVIGTYDLRLVDTFKRVSNYSASDFAILARLISGFRNLLATPHVLTEVSNLANSLPWSIKADWFNHFSRRITRLEERHIPAANLASLPEFSVFGLTDAALFELAKSTLLVTADERLASHLRRRELFVLGFNEIPAGALFPQR